MPGRLMYHQIFTCAQKIFIKKRKYFADNKNNAKSIFNLLFFLY
ncbi:transporter [Salmonella bongori]|uniref:Uncharacterized protein n=1 Tax=Salmonella bongori N268-08 TaxID=1197719 RepID=S5NHH7_SALBN|nr:hypothetical protein A464_2527 [Salmonella bongori N268-08]VDZ77667.1 transporter [Salmonella bongori]